MRLSSRKSENPLEKQSIGQNTFLSQWCSVIIIMLNSCCPSHFHHVVYFLPSISLPVSWASKCVYLLDSDYISGWYPHPGNPGDWKTKYIRGSNAIVTVLVNWGADAKPGMVQYTSINVCDRLLSNMHYWLFDLALMTNSHYVACLT